MYDGTVQYASLTYKFTGKERDSESGLDNFGARYFGSSLGRFTSPDPENAGAHEVDPQTWNAYSYTRNNPLLFTDPDGLDFEVCQTDDKGKKTNCLVFKNDKDFDRFRQQSKDLVFEKGKIFTRNFDGTLRQIGTAEHSTTQECCSGRIESANGMNMLMVAPFAGLVTRGLSAAQGLGGAGSRQVGTVTTTGVSSGAAGQLAANASGQALRLTSHAALRAAQRGISQGEIDAAVQTARVAGRVVQQIGRYGTPQEVYQGTNGVTVVIETAGRNAGKAIPVWRQGTTP